MRAHLLTLLTAAVTGTGSAASEPESSMGPPSDSTGSAVAISAANVGRTLSPAPSDALAVEAERWRWFTACIIMVVTVLRRLS